MNRTDGLKIERVSIDALRPDDRNARQHDERNIAAIVASLRLHGQVEALVIQKSTGKIIGGNGRVEAMKRLGWTETDVVYVDVDDAQAVALGITLNRTAETSPGWDFPVLKDLIAEIDTGAFDIESLGWTKDELETIFSHVPVQPPAEFKDVEAGMTTEFRCPKCKYEWSGQPKPE